METQAPPAPPTTVHPNVILDAQAQLLARIERNTAVAAANMQTIKAIAVFWLIATLIGACAFAVMIVMQQPV